MSEGGRDARERVACCASSYIGCAWCAACVASREALQVPEDRHPPFINLRVLVTKISCRPTSAWRLVPTPSLPVASSLVVLVLNSLHSWLLLSLSVVMSFPLCACSGDEVGKGGGLERWGPNHISDNAG